MKKSLIALAALAASTAFAQSTVTLFGGADINYRSVTSGANKFSGMAQDGIFSSRLGVRGVEDLGGGLKANFHFESGMNPDAGTPGGLNFLRRSVVELEGGLGKVGLGRDYTPAFLVHGIADPFGTNGVGSFLNLGGSTVETRANFASATAAGLAARTDASTFLTIGTNTGILSAPAPAAVLPATNTYADPAAVRSNNSIMFTTPNFNGFTASYMIGFGNENTASQKNVGEVSSLNIRYAQGPLSVGLATQTTKGGLTGSGSVASALTFTNFGAGLTAAQKTACTNAGGTLVTVDTVDNACKSAALSAIAGTDDQKWRTNVIAASYDLRVAKLSYLNRSDKLAAEDFKATTQLVGVTAPMGPVLLRASYITKKVNAEKAGTQVAVGGIYDLSKRTAAYATYSVLTNKAAGLANSVGSAAASEGGVKSKGFEVGVRHTF